MSADIFEDDPLLLKDENQQEYGRELLWNILLRRTAMSGRTELIDLFEEDLVQTPSGATPQQPLSAELIDRYRNSRIERSELSNDDFKALSGVTMVCRGEATERRLRETTDTKARVLAPFAFHDQAVEELAAKKVDLEARFRVAAVGVRVKVSRQVGTAALGEDLCMLEPLPIKQEIEGVPEDTGIAELGRTIWDGDPAQWGKWVETVCGHIRSAVESGSEIVLLPEFGLPPELDGKSIETRILNGLEGIAGERKPFLIFAGSRHDGGFNRGLIRYIRPDGAEHSTTWHYKIASARSLGENILGPKSNTYKTFELEADLNSQPFFLLATVAICYDAFDPSTFLSLVLHAAIWKNREVPQVILVPSFNPSSEFVSLLRDLSFLTGGVVIYVNSLHGDAHAFIAGFAATDFLAPSLNDMLSQLDDHIDMLEKFRKGAPSEVRAATKRGETQLVEATQRRAKQYQKRLPILVATRARLELLRQANAFDHLVTVERCKLCEAKGHPDDYQCKTDILYYNIDPRLIEALADWRLFYFGVDESFLPEPFRRELIEGEAERMVELKARRAAAA